MFTLATLEFCSKAQSQWPTKQNKTKQKTHSLPNQSNSQEEVNYHYILISFNVVSFPQNNNDDIIIIYCC